MQQSPQSFEHQEGKAPEKIPPLSNIAPSIFVPIQDDFLGSEPPRDRVERLKRILQSIDYMRSGVKENLMYMFEREKRRIVLEATEMEQAQGTPKLKPDLSPREVDDIIANMEAPAAPGMDYDIRTIPATTPTVPPNASLRDRTVIELLAVVENGLKDIQGYDEHMTSPSWGINHREEAHNANADMAV
ncbi:hypothetical protein NEMBOFW57_009731 [Staphylotrichum longicolle]|uniref:Uncharacterized protein n=1 Tax=Staphylotrichum longicolle TaxID=669026 RepID=A0AAD4EPV3_9PEZI|nr:hypothetical protein NEMBOFW57_009731 [Staphylotrichum longicolle]